jgi:hypothetical protein
MQGCQPPWLQLEATTCRHGTSVKQVMLHELGATFVVTTNTCQCAVRTFINQAAPGTTTYT